MLITIGRVVKPFGVKGEVRIELMTDFPERFKGLGRIYLVSPAGREISCEIRAVRYRDSVPYILLKGYDSPEKAKELNGWFVKLPEQEAVQLPEGSYYWFEIIGMEVFSEAGEKLGRITEVFKTGSNDVYVMKHGRKETYIPATKEVVKQVDRAAKRMIIHVMDGLMD